jgi:hypothetical protein
MNFRSIPIAIILFAFTGCSFVGTVSSLEPVNSVTWCADTYADEYSMVGNVSSFRFESTDVIIVIRTDVFGNRGLRQPPGLSENPLLLGPLYLPIVPNPLFPLWYLRGGGTALTFWCEINVAESPLRFDPNEVKVSALSGQIIKPRNIDWWHKHHYSHSGYYWVPDSIDSARTLSKDTVAISFDLDFSIQDSLVIDFGAISPLIPSLTLARRTHWIFVPITRLHT